ncbi:circularly permuted type 2 ATP-grasp protein [Novosphingobium mangrovi (ex Hu et al. 2023)]|uniref:Circularly permuted type 2 ATP-grasp protein n=1 Tax=Novosphingobium mangrovi (ex Hu et al. 2023) TaxID=2930094 RepID=A0ABT0AH95_9SPHN|nr:circularly permuted type 2 ATP-grasp protein [Novosphingobium mangrovi (ex Hu et al. 2023)]MCJ1962581.1 circularly permuted type 2 ATP-grasp protein [Novosphingobium mangrovi (ex Hu et al. 2023)]
MSTTNAPKFDEMLNEDGTVRSAYVDFRNWYDAQDKSWLKRQDGEAERFFRRIGITFNVYGESDAEERLIPFDMIPRIITAKEWRKLTKGIEQRVRAINAFLQDLYHRQEIIRSGRLPISALRNNEAFLSQMIGFTPPGGVYTHIVGIDLVRTGPDEFMVLEDNARTPSGVSYMLENRETMMAMFPDLFTQIPVRPVSDYPRRLARSLRACAPAAYNAAGGKRPVVAVLTPGIYNSAYFEHAFLADQMGAELVEGSDLRIMNGRVAMRTTTGYKAIDVIYRRVDDDYLDPLTFNADSVLGVAGIMDVYRSGGVTIANAPGTGIADDKAIYSYMPEIVEFYTGEKPILNNVPTWRCSEEDSLAYVLDNLKDLVVKEVHGSGGYGMLIGPTSSKKELAAFEQKLRAKPENYIAQPTLSLSTVPIFTREGLAPRHVDLRPFVLVSPDGIDITPGGLTRVALKKGSLVVNSSQGGGTKDSWVLED